MKRFIIILIVLVMLMAGCTENVPDPTTTVMTQPTSESTAAPEPGIYVPGSAVEQQTYGSVRMYHPGASFSLAMMGEKLITFTWDANDHTTLTLYSGEDLVKGTSVKVETFLFPRTATVQITENAVGYFDEGNKSVVILNAMLQEQNRVAVPDSYLGNPVLSEDLNYLYYWTSAGIRATDLTTGTSRLVRQYDKEQVQIQAVCCNGAYLRCSVTEGNETYTDFISTQTGQSIGADTSIIDMQSWGNNIYLERWEGTVVERLFQLEGTNLQSIQIENDNAFMTPLLSMGGVLTQEANNTGVLVSYYELYSGKKVAQVQLDGFANIYGFVADAANESVWFLSYDYVNQEDMLYQWQLKLSTVVDETDYTTVRYTRENPDTAGLQACREKADQLEQTYGVKIFLDEQLPSPGDYSFVYEYQTEPFKKGLEALETAMGKFPEGFFKQIAKASKNGVLQIGLVRDMRSITQEAPSDTVGLQYWLENNMYISLSAGDGVEGAFYHEVFHVLENYVYSKTSSYDAWNALNPKGFQYDGNYTDYQTRTDTSLLEGEKRAFIDWYSMTYAKEDRARIFEYAIVEGNEAYFTSEVMQNKLQQICIGIREAFQWKKDSRTFVWEQYLDGPLKYNNPLLDFLAGDI